MAVRLIDANALMDFARNHVNRTVDSNDIARFPTLDYVPRQQWISVKDRLPEESENRYLVRLEDGFIGTAVWDDGWELWNDSGEVTHWMCLPEPPKEARNDS